MDGASQSSGLPVLGAPSPRAFANRAVMLPAWYPVTSSRALRRGGVQRVAIGAQDVVVWRGDDGAAHVAQARCPHLGADLGRGRVVDNSLRCMLHHWRFAGDGACIDAPQAAPGRCLRTFPTLERWGLVFAWLGHASTSTAGTSGPVPLPPMPRPGDGPADDRDADGVDDGVEDGVDDSVEDGVDDERRYLRLVLPATKLACHHHLTTGNGLDAVHFQALHDGRALAPPRHAVDEARGAVHLDMHLRSNNAVVHALCGALRFRFSAYGPSIAWVSAIAPVRLHALFCTRPEPDGGSSSRAVLFVPKDDPLRALRAIAFLLWLLRQDDQQLDALREFQPAFVTSDAPLRDYAALLERWPPQPRGDTP